ncbi:hypothetical protein FRB90_000889 [Tulasnella sp. 427]|nr:hypothetical protein FRB90_000889 [Tulasnella sp. 427]
MEHYSSDQAIVKPDQQETQAQKSYRDQDTSSFSVLPPEIVIVVLHACAHVPDNPKIRNYFDYPSLFKVRSISRQWKRIVDSSPRLWNGVVRGHNLNLIEMVLHHSGTEPLNVRWNRLYSLSISTNYSASFMNLVMPSVRRWRILYYQASADDELESMLGLPFQGIQELNIDPERCRHYAPAIQAPKLADLWLHGCTLDWHALSRLRSLTMLELGSEPAHAVRVDELTAVLRTSPDLEALCVEESILVDVLPFDRVVLPKLKSLSLMELPPAPLSSILDGIKAPSLVEFDTWIEPRQVSNDALACFESAGRHFGGDLGSRDQDSSQLDIRIDRNYLKLEAEGRRVVMNARRARARVGDAFIRDLATRALKGFHPSFCHALSSVSIEACPPTSGLVDFFRTLHTELPQVKELTLTGYDKEEAGVETLVDALCLEHEISESSTMPAVTGTVALPYCGSLEIKHNRIERLL